jgi:hypothetical protein
MLPSITVLLTFYYIYFTPEHMQRKEAMLWFPIKSIYEKIYNN